MNDMSFVGLGVISSSEGKRCSFRVNVPEKSWLSHPGEAELTAAAM
jgi:hypothetical protein